MNLPLNIDFQQIFLHLFNFVVLFAVLYFLLYNPVKKFMEARIEHYKKLDDKAKANLAESEKKKEEYMERLATVDKEISKKKEKMRKEIDEANELRMKQAKKEAEKLISNGHKTIERERAKMLKDVQEEISDMVTAATEKLILNASTSQAYDNFLDAVKRSESDEQE